MGGGKHSLPCFQSLVQTHLSVCQERYPAMLSISPIPLSLPAGACVSSLTLNFTGSGFAIKQTRTRQIDDFATDECSWQAWGVGTILLGGDNSNSQFYWFDCFHSTLSEGLTWVRVDSDEEVNNSPLTGGTRIAFSSALNSGDGLGLYACVATDGSMEFLNITDRTLPPSLSLPLPLSLTLSSSLSLPPFLSL